MIRRILPLALIASLLLAIGLATSPGNAAEKKKGFVALKSLKTDFFVAAGDNASWKVNGDEIRLRILRKRPCPGSN